MKFNEVVLDKLGPIFQEYNLFIVDQFENYIKLKSDHLVISITHDEKENANLLYMGVSEDTQHLIDYNIIKNILGSNIEEDLIIPELTINDFVDNLRVFFKKEKDLFLEKNKTRLKLIENYSTKVSLNYTEEILQKQILVFIDKAWEEGNYKAFIEYLDKIDRKKIPHSYELKYRIASNKIVR
jgi:hypothetical protein